MVLIPYIVMSSTTPFPGLAALSSVIGTALLIRYGNTGWISRLLGWRPFVATGKISYSLYLWHWPVTVFWKYAVYDQLYWYDYAGMFLLSFLLAALSWRFVEVPVRASPVWTMRRSFAFATAGIVLLTSVGMACVFSNGWPTVLHVKANSVSCINDFQSRVVRICIGMKKCAFAICGKKVNDPFRLAFGSPGDFHLGVPGKMPEFLLVGDSHAGHLQHGLNALLTQTNRAGFAINHSATNMFNLESSDAKYVIEWLKQNPKVKNVVLASNWAGHIRKSTPESVFSQVESFAKYIASDGRTLFILSDTPNFLPWSSDMPPRMTLIAPRKMEYGWDGRQSEFVFETQRGEINRRLETISGNTGAVFVPLHTAMKHGDYYDAMDESQSPPVLLYKDEHHLSRAGSLKAAAFLMQYLFPTQ